VKMLTNTDCTLYLTEDGKTYRRVYCPACHWEDTRGQNINKTGSTAVDSVRVFLPLSAADLAGVKGYLVRGACAFYQSSDHPIRELVTQGNALTVTSAARCDFGSLTLHHWEVYAK
jgi:hypothetical protein